MIAFPPKYPIFGVSASATTYKETIKTVLDAAHQGVPATVTHLAVHGLITSSEDDSLEVHKCF